MLNINILLKLTANTTNNQTSQQFL